MVVIDSDVNSSLVSCRIGTDNLEAGRMAAEAVLAQTEGELIVGIVNFDENTANGQEREAGFRQAMEESGRVGDMTTINAVSYTHLSATASSFSWRRRQRCRRSSSSASR